MNTDKEKKFISERILGREMTLRRAVRWVLVSLLCGLVFGAAAFGMYYIGRSAAEAADKKRAEAVQETETETADQLETQPEIRQETQPGTQPETETAPSAPETSPTETETGETKQEDGPEEGTQASVTEEETREETGGENDEETDGEAGEETESSAVTEVPTGSEMLRYVSGAQQEACERIAKYIVRVSSTVSEVTWFESTVETRKDYSGIVAAEGEDEILILTVQAAAGGSGSLSVKFYDGTCKEAVVKQQSERDGLAMLAVSTEGLGTEFLEGIEACTCVSREEVLPGMAVITAGSPMGVDNSYGFGNINHVGETESIEDGSQVCCYTEAASVPSSGTFLMSMDGRLVGLAAEQEEDSDITGSRFIVAETCQTLLEAMKKGYDMAWLGITGTDISFDMKYKNMPQGMYVTAVNEDSPAFAAGLKRGDIIVSTGTREIRGLSDYCSFLKNLRPGETVTITVQRETIHSEYKQVDLLMTAGTRE